MDAEKSLEEDSQVVEVLLAFKVRKLPRGQASFSVPQVAAFFGVNRHRVDHWVKILGRVDVGERVPRLRLRRLGSGRRYLFSREQLLKLAVMHACVEQFGMSVRGGWSVACQTIPHGSSEARRG
jgi:hypothetical protein